MYMISEQQIDKCFYDNNSNVEQKVVTRNVIKYSTS